MITAKSYVAGRVETIPVDHKIPIIIVTLPHGGTVQLDIDYKGNVMLRGWGNEPDLVGRRTQFIYMNKVQYEPRSTCNNCGNPTTRSICPVCGKDLEYDEA